MNDLKLPTKMENNSKDSIFFFRGQSIKRLTQGLSGVLENPNLVRVRRPKDSSLQLHRVVGEWMEKKFGINYRELGLFCSGDIEIAKGYAKQTGYALIKIAPIGDYSICFSEKCVDLFGHFQFLNQSTTAEIEKSLETLEFKEYINSGMNEAIQCGCEVMLFAKTFAYQRLA